MFGSGLGIRVTVRVFGSGLGFRACGWRCGLWLRYREGLGLELESELEFGLGGVGFRVRVIVMFALQ